MFKKRSAIACTAMALAIILGGENFAHASPSLASVQAQITSLQVQAAAAAEAGQQAQVELGRLTRSLNSVQQQDSQQTKSMASLKQSIGAIANQEYQSNGISQGMSLLFSSNPTLYLQAAGSLSVVTAKKALQLSRFTTAEQRLRATSLTLNDQLALVVAAKAKYAKQEALAQSRLAQAEALLAKLTKEQRDALAKLQANQDNADQQASLALAAQGVKVSGRAGIAIRYALKQLGSRYRFGAAGLVYWDCSGLTMQAFAAAGVSLPHSAAAQSSYGKYVPLNKIQPGDLIFFGRPISHVGIYYGNGKMLDAPHTGARVRIESFSSYFGGEKFVAARRF
jgi:cell wall-associated NlpC family hydrolase